MFCKERETYDVILTMHIRLARRFNCEKGFLWERGTTRGTSKRQTGYSREQEGTKFMDFRAACRDITALGRTNPLFRIKAIAMILCCFPEKGRREIELEIVQEVKERYRKERGK